MAKVKKRPASKKIVNNVDQEKLLKMEFVFNALLRRSELLSSLMDPRRNINDECGYPETTSLTPHFYRDLFDREPIASRVVEVIPQESWKVQPSIYEDEDPDTTTPFEQAWKDMEANLRSSIPFEYEEGSPIYESLLRADVLSGIGSYGALLLVLGDSGDLSDPAPVAEGQQLLGLRAFDESMAEIASLETDVTSPRYGLPTAYNLMFSDPKDPHQGVGIDVSQKRVHWSRVLHFADNLLSSEVYGVPRMRPVVNRLLDLRKLHSGSAEMYWRGAFPGISLETLPEAIDLDVDASALKDQMEQYMNGLQRYFSLVGMSAKTLAPQVVDPASQIEVQIDAICIKYAVPKRIFMGSERGELASSQDDDSWNDRMRARQRNYITPRILVPFVCRLIDLGVLPKPAEPLHVWWPDLGKTSEPEKATVALTKTDAMQRYVTAGVDTLIDPKNFLTKIIGFTEEETEEIQESTMEHIAAGGIETPVDDIEEEGRQLDLEAKRKSIDLMGKEPKSGGSKAGL